MNGKRAGAAVGGVLALGLVSAVSFGLALLAPLGMWISAWLVRRQGQATTKLTSWLGAVYGVGMVIVVVAAVSMVKLTVGNHDPAYQRALDSVTTANRNKPPPAWMEKIAPGSTERARASRLDPGSKGFAALGVGGSVIGAVFVGTIVGLLIGSLAWAACLPLYFAINGRWLGEPTVVP